ncbi:hypothetical protein HII36_47170 [Nonomuraea sp. NN258]|uniref:hypothetical protein n=1 Tax=Nonomuraea antri TaxID=2730852 RepID=UPI001568509C|nr:hypothetical protein [Nonomuraea antri]NRQ39356.1 hypothetical protein [Nonomuraea antri]
MQGDLQPLHDNDPPLIDSYRLMGRLAESPYGVTYLARSAGGRDVTLMLINSPATAGDSADGVRQSGNRAYVVQDYAGPALPKRTWKRSRDRLTPTLLTICVVLAVLYVIVIGYLWYYNIDLQPLRDAGPWIRET